MNFTIRDRKMKDIRFGWMACRAPAAGCINKSEIAVGLVGPSLGRIGNEDVNKKILPARAETAGGGNNIMTRLDRPELSASTTEKQMTNEPTLVQVV